VRLARQDLRVSWRRWLFGTKRLWIVLLVVLLAVIALYVLLLAVALKAGSF
jgi:hypothetical protein